MICEGVGVGQSMSKKPYTLLTVIGLVLVVVVDNLIRNLSIFSSGHSAYSIFLVSLLMGTDGLFRVTLSKFHFVFYLTCEACHILSLSVALTFSSLFPHQKKHFVPVLVSHIYK